MGGTCTSEYRVYCATCQAANEQVSMYLADFYYACSYLMMFEEVSTIIMHACG